MERPNTAWVCAKLTFAFDDRESCSKNVSLEFLYGTCLLPDPRELMTSPRALSERLMFWASFSCCPSAAVDCLDVSRFSRYATSRKRKDGDEDRHHTLLGVVSRSENLERNDVATSFVLTFIRSLPAKSMRFSLPCCTYPEAMSVLVMCTCSTR